MDIERRRRGAAVSRGPDRHGRRLGDPHRDQGRRADPRRARRKQEHGRRNRRRTERRGDRPRRRHLGDQQRRLVRLARAGRPHHSRSHAAEPRRRLDPARRYRQRQGRDGLRGLRRQAPGRAERPGVRPSGRLLVHRPRLLDPRRAQAWRALLRQGRRLGDRARPRSPDLAQRRRPLAGRARRLHGRHPAGPAVGVRCRRPWRAGAAGRLRYRALDRQPPRSAVPRQPGGRGGRQGVRRHHLERRHHGVRPGREHRTCRLPRSRHHQHLLRRRRHARRLGDRLRPPAGSTAAAGRGPG